MIKLAHMATAVAVLACACAPAAEDAPAQEDALAGTSWTVVALEGQPPLGGRGGAPTIAFDAETGVSGSTSCNRFTGAVTRGPDDAISFGAEGAGLATTRMACAPMLNDQESRMLRVLGEVASYAVGADGRLALKSAAGETVVEAAPAAAAPDAQQ